MTSNDALELLEPEGRHRGEHATLVRNRFGHHDIERTQTVGSDHEEAIVTRVVNVANFAGIEVGQCVGHGGGS